MGGKVRLINFNLYVLNTTKIYSILSVDLNNVNYKTIKVVGGNIREYFHSQSSNLKSLKRKQNVLAKDNTNNLCLIEIKISYLSKYSMKSLQGRMKKSYSICNIYNIYSIYNI